VDHHLDHHQTLTNDTETHQNTQSRFSPTKSTTTDVSSNSNAYDFSINEVKQQTASHFHHSSSPTSSSSSGGGRDRSKIASSFDATSVDDLLDMINSPIPAVTPSNNNKYGNHNSNSSGGGIAQQTQYGTHSHNHNSSSHNGSSSSGQTSFTYSSSSNNSNSAIDKHKSLPVASHHTVFNNNSQNDHNSHSHGETKHLSLQRNASTNLTSNGTMPMLGNTHKAKSMDFGSPQPQSQQSQASPPGKPTSLWAPLGSSSNISSNSSTGGAGTTHIPHIHSSSNSSASGTSGSSGTSGTKLR